jgi:hypothetical protein
MLPFTKEKIRKDFKASKVQTETIVYNEAKEDNYLTDRLNVKETSETLSADIERLLTEK